MALPKTMNVILIESEAEVWGKSDTVWCFSGEFVVIQAKAKRGNALIIKVGMTCEDC
jgi:hypothetical protein